MSGRGEAVKGHSPSRPDGEVLTEEPEEVRWPVLPQAGMSPVLSRLGKSVVPHLNTHRDVVETWSHYATRRKRSTPNRQSAARREIRVGALLAQNAAVVTMAMPKRCQANRLHKPTEFIAPRLVSLIDKGA